MSLDLSIIVVSWNTRALTLECIDAVQAALGAQGSPPLRWELIVVDNGSSDGTVEALRARDPEVPLIALPGNRGFARANNEALGQARGRHVLLLNSDARLTREVALGCVDALDKDPRAAIAGPQLVHPDGRLQNSVHAFPGLVSELLPLWLLELAAPSRFPSKRSVGRDPVEVDAVQGAALFARRDLLVEWGGLPEAYFFFLEETALCWRARAEGYRVWHLPALHMTHALGASSKQPFPVETAIEFHRSLYRFLGDHRGPWTRRIATTSRVLRALVGLPFSSARRRSTRLALLRWHLRGQPSDEGLAASAAAACEDGAA